MAKKDLIQDVIAASSNRRSMIRKLGIATAAVAAGATAGGKKLSAQSTTPTPTEVVQFALNLEYLESEFYSVATMGKTLEARGYNFMSGVGTYGSTTTAYGAVNFSNSLVDTGQVAKFLEIDELNHVLVLRAALGNNAIAKPAINLDALAAKGASLLNEATFLTMSRILEDIGLSAYAGGAPYLSGSPYLLTAARITGVEGEHVANVRLQIARLGIASSMLDGADVVPPPTGSNFFSTNPSNGLCAIRTPGEVLYLAYGNMAGVTMGGFFPAGVNGPLKMSSEPATANNLATVPTDI